MGEQCKSEATADRSLESSTTVKSQCTLQPINLWNAVELDELLRQRILCGWEKTSSSIQAWRAAMDTKELSLFWIIPASLANLPVPERYVGHIGISNKTAARPDGHGSERVGRHIFNLFILQERRVGGLGRQAVEMMERMAKTEPYGSAACRFISINTYDRRYVEDDAAEWRGFYSKLCAELDIEMPAKGRSNQDWYARMGYVKYGEQPMYPVSVDGKENQMLAVLLRKELD